MPDGAEVVAGVGHLPLDLPAQRGAPTDDRPARHPELPDGILGQHGDDLVDLRSRLFAAVTPSSTEFADEIFLS
ncbi:hypothetical protein D3C85_1513480 [compost metagenome]